MESFFAGGAIAGPALAGPLFQVLGYKGPFLMTAVANALSIIVGLFVVPNDPPADGEDFLM